MSQFNSLLGTLSNGTIIDLTLRFHNYSGIPEFTQKNPHFVRLDYQYIAKCLASPWDAITGTLYLEAPTNANN